MIHHVARAYPNGEIVRGTRTTAELDDWRLYNTHMRPGCAHFLDGECIDQGINLSRERCEEISAILKKELQCEAPSSEAC